MHEQLREQLAAVEHERWAGWQSWMHSQCLRKQDGSLIIPPHLVERWERQMVMLYSQLSEEEKESDRMQVDRYWKIVEEYVNAHTNG